MPLAAPMTAEAAIGLLVIFTGVIVYFAVDAVRWRSRRRALLVGLALPLSALSCLAVWTMLTNPSRLPAWHGGFGVGFDPDWDCGDPNQKAGQICVREAPDRSPR